MYDHGSVGHDRMGTIYHLPRRWYGNIPVQKRFSQGGACRRTVRRPEAHDARCRDRPLDGHPGPGRPRHVSLLLHRRRREHHGPRESPVLPQRGFQEQPARDQVGKRSPAPRHPRCAPRPHGVRTLLFEEPGRHQQCHCLPATQLYDIDGQEISCILPHQRYDRY